MSSKRRSDSRGSSTGLDRLEDDLPTTAADVEALRRARSRPPRPLSEVIDLLSPPDWIPRPKRRKTSEGWEPFEL